MPPSPRRLRYIGRAAGRIPLGAFWFLEGMLVSLLAITILFARREDIVVDALLPPRLADESTSGARVAEARAVAIMHGVHSLLWPRLVQLESTKVGTDFWFRSTYSHLMAPTGHCGSFSQVLARALQRDGFDVKIGQMLVKGVWAAHVVVLASVGDRWVALDPYFDVAFHAPDGTLLAVEDIRRDWEHLRTQCPPNYDPSYRYEDVRFTNWRGIPVDLLGAFFGGVSLRTHFLNLYWVIAAVAAGALLAVCAIHRTAARWAMACP